MQMLRQDFDFAELTTGAFVATLCLIGNDALRWPATLCSVVSHLNVSVRWCSGFSPIMQCCASNERGASSGWP